MAAFVQVVFPAPGGPSRSDVEGLIGELAAEPTEGALVAGDERVREFLIALSRRLLQPGVARRHPELGSLGFFLRRSELDRAVEHIAGKSPAAVRVPRGLAIHFTPANVATIFAYSWAVSALAGNRNVVRISERLQSAGSAVLGAMNEAIAEAHPAIRDTQRVISYAHDEATTASLCAACDVRVMWGGDAAVQTLRGFQVPPTSRDVAFPDRSSSAAISVSAWHAADDKRRRAAVEGFATDVYWFDQAACSSPRNLVWVGETSQAVAARQHFQLLLSDVLAERGWGVDASMAVEKRVKTYGLAARGRATSLEFLGNAIANVELADLGSWEREWLGAGTICHLRVDQLDQIAGVISRKDQTLTQFGFSDEELARFVNQLGGRGIDRIVPFGQALAFSRVWDGMDLIDEFTRIVTIQA
jgi:hypothetical protein